MPPESTLRPLGLGEMLDRAVNLSVKQFKTFALIYVVFAVPFAVVQYFATRDQVSVLQALTDVLQRQASGQRSDPQVFSKVFAHTPPLSEWSVAFLVFAFFLTPLPSAALIVATSRAYLGARPTFSEAYRIALRRWLPLIGVNLLFLVVGAIVYVVAILAAVAIGFALVFVSGAFHAIGVVATVLVVTALVLVAVAFALVAALAYQVAYFTCVLENAPVFKSFEWSVRRVFGAVGIRRALLVSVAWVAVSLAIVVVTSIGQALLVGVARNQVLGEVYSTAVLISTAAFVTAFIGIFYFDLRVRSEGLDLQLAARPSTG